MHKTFLLELPAVVDLDDGQTTIQVTNANEHTYTLEANINLTKFQIPTPLRATNMTPMPVEHLNLLKEHPDETNAMNNQYIVNTEMKSTKRYPTLELCYDPGKFNYIQRL